MEAKEYEALGRDIVWILQVTTDYLGVRDTRDLRERKASFVNQICEGCEFAIIRLNHLALGFRRADKGEVFFLACEGDEGDGWLEAMEESFRELDELDYKFEVRRVGNVSSYLSTLSSVYGLPKAT